MPGRGKVSAEEAQSILDRLQKGTTTLKREHERLGLATNAPIRKALLPLLGNDRKRYMDVVMRRREKAAGA
jgi:hypothetical protein